MRKFTFIALATLLIPQIALGWGQLGHRTIAEIAERNLTPKAKANIEKYTAGTPLWKYSLFVDEERNNPLYKEPLYGLTPLLQIATAPLHRLSATATVTVRMA